MAKTKIVVISTDSLRLLAHRIKISQILLIR